MQNMINFPLNDLDLSRHVHILSPETCYLYDLFALVNHFGTMQNGHYISMVKNECTGEWLQYNDSQVRPVTEREIHTNSAYILFYRRKDLVGKPLESVIPTLNVTRFPGMPVHIKAGYLTSKPLVATLLEYREGHPCPFKMGLQSGAILFLSAKAVERDPDCEQLNHLRRRR